MAALTQKGGWPKARHNRPGKRPKEETGRAADEAQYPTAHPPANFFFGPTLLRNKSDASNVAHPTTQQITRVP